MLTEIVVPITPVPASRPRVKRNGTVYYSKRYTQFRKDMERFWKMHNSKIFAKSIPLAVDISLEIPLPKSIRSVNRGKISGTPHIGSTDIDNIFKGILDSMNGIIFEDDASVWKLSGTKRWTSAQNGKITIKIENYYGSILPGDTGAD